MIIQNSNKNCTILCTIQAQCMPRSPNHPLFNISAVALILKVRRDTFSNNSIALYSRHFLDCTPHVLFCVLCYLNTTASVNLLPTLTFCMLLFSSLGKLLSNVYTTSIGDMVSSATKKMDNRVDRTGLVPLLSTLLSMFFIAIQTMGTTPQQPYRKFYSIGNTKSCIPLLPLQQRSPPNQSVGRTHTQSKNKHLCRAP